MDDHLSNILIMKNTRQLADISQSNTVAAVSNTYAINIANKPIINIRIATADATAKTVSVSNVSTECELLIELTYTNAAAITWFNGITWLNGIPSFATGKIYRIMLFTKNSGTNWYGAVVGGW